MLITPLVVGITGGTSSGKTTVTRSIATALGKDNVTLLQHDAYYKDIAMFGEKPVEDINFDHPDAYDTGLYIEHLMALKKGAIIHQPVYDYRTYRRTDEKQEVYPRSLIIVEGILILADVTLRNLIDIKIYVDTDDDERLLRRLRRDIIERGRSIESVINQYIHSVKPMHLEFVEPSKRWADVIIPRGGENHVAIDMVLAKLKSLVPSP